MTPPTKISPNTREIINLIKTATLGVAPNHTRYHILVLIFMVRQFISVKLSRPFARTIHQCDCRPKNLHTTHRWRRTKWRRK